MFFVFACNLNFSCHSLVYLLLIFLNSRFVPFNSPSQGDQLGGCVRVYMLAGPGDRYCLLLPFPLSQGREGRGARVPVLCMRVLMYVCAGP